MRGVILGWRWVWHFPSLIRKQSGHFSLSLSSVGPCTSLATRSLLSYSCNRKNSSTRVTGMSHSVTYGQHFLNDLTYTMIFVLNANTLKSAIARAEPQGTARVRGNSWDNTHWALPHGPSNKHAYSCVRLAVSVNWGRKGFHSCPSLKVFFFETPSNDLTLHLPTEHTRHTQP